MADQDIAPIALTPVEMQVQQAAIDRQRQLALALQQASFQSPEGQMISGHYVAPSWTQQAARLAQGLVGKSQQGYLDDQQRTLARVQGDAIRGQFGIGGQPQQPDQPSIPQMPLGSGMSDATSPEANANAKLAAMLLPQSSQGGTSAPAAGSRVIPGMNPLQAFQLYNSDPKNYDAAYLKQFDPTDLQKNSRYMGISADENAKATRAEMATKGLMNLKQEGTVFDVTTGQPIFTAPDSKLGSYMTWKGGIPSMAPIAGAADIRAAMAAAERRGTNQETLAPKDMQPTFDNGTSGTRSINATLHPDNAGFPAGVQVPQPTNVGPMVKGQSDTLSILQQERANAKPADIPAIDREIEREKARQQPSAPQGVGAKFGQQQGAEAAQKELSDKYSSLNADNRQAQTTNSYLQSIKQLADKGGVGAFSDKVQLTNNLLSYAGISAKATNEVTAKVLLDKYSKQITSRLGGGPNGSDARSAIIEAAYPNSKMTTDAIHEAVDNLVSANKMTQAKTQLLAPHANARDPVAYSQKEVAFDQAADPRIWQYANMPPAQKAQFRQQMQQNGESADFANKIRTLESLGVNLK